MADLTQEDLSSLLKTCVYCREFNPINRYNFVTRRSSAKHDEAMILFMLDTGLRDFELSNLKIGELDLRTGKVVIKHGGKCRTVYLAKGARKSVKRYLANREDGDNPNTPSSSAMRIELSTRIVCVS